MIGKFKKWIIHCINDRTDDILNQMAVDNKAFRRLTQELTPLIDAAKYNLTDEHKYLLEEMDDIRGPLYMNIYICRFGSNAVVYNICNRSFKGVSN